MSRGGWVRWVVSFSVLVGGVALTLAVAQIATAAAGAQADEQARAIRGSSIDRLLGGAEATFHVTHAMKAFVVGHDGDPQDWEIRPFLRVLAEQGKFVRSIALAPGNRITHIEPLAGNEAALGLYYPDQAEQWPAIRAIIESGQPVVVGPFPLVQGGRGLAYRLPMIIDNTYWGMASTVIDADAYFSYALESAAGTGVALGVRAVGDGGTGVIAGDSGAFGDLASVEPVEVLGSLWEVGTVPAPVDVAPAMVIRTMGLLTSLVIATLVFLFIGSLQRRREATNRLAMLSRQVPGVLFQWRVAPDGTGELPFVSDRAVDYFGTEVPGGSVPVLPLWEQFVPEDARRVQEVMADASTRQAVHERLRRVDPQGRTQWFLAEARSERVDDGSVLWHGFLSDVSEEVQAEKALRISASVFNSTHDAVVISDPGGGAVDVNPAFTALMGYTRAETLGRTLEMLGAGLTPPEVFDDMRASLARHNFWRGEVSARTKDGRVISQAVAVSGVRDDKGHISHFVSVISGLDNAHDDFVTGLPSRQALDDRLAQGLDWGRANGRSVALLVVGLDDFRDVNETMGHRVGDTVLRQAAARLRDEVPDEQTVARVGGDEFAIVITDNTDPLALDELATRCLSAIMEPFPASARPLHLTASIGIALFPEDSQTASALLSHANQALHVAKGQGKGIARYFTASMQSDAMERAGLADDLRRALAERQLHVVYQPVVDLATGLTAKVEALVRWTHPERGPISPAVFIPVAEKSGLVRGIGDFVFAESIAWLAHARTVVPDLALGFNVSPAELQDDGSRHEDRLALLARAQIPGSAIILEITEGLLLQQSTVVATALAAYRNAGVRFAIDDFGTGYSSLSYLQQLDVDFVKIDRAFVTGLTVASGNRALCEAIIAMSHSLGLSVIAEGIETQGQRAALSDMGCDFGQGYLFSQGLLGDRVIDFLTAQR